MKRFFWALLLLAACAPSPEERVDVVQFAEPAAFYPHQTGAVWSYLAEGEPRSARPLYQRVEGPTVVDGERFVAWRTVGRGLDTRTYRVYRPEGVFIAREAGPGYVTTLEPPIQEWPAPDELVMGASWGAQARATVRFPEAGEARSFRFDYRYDVVDERRVTVEAGTFEVFVVAFESRSFDEEGNVEETLRQEVWFAPFVGEVRTDTGLYLVDTNFSLQRARK